MSDSSWPHESQHTRPPCPSPTPGVHSDSRPSRKWCHSAISSSVGPFSSCPQSLLASESFPMSQLFASGGQNTGVSALVSFLPKKSQGRSPCSPRDSQESPTPQFKSISSSALSFLYSPTLIISIHDYWKCHISVEFSSVQSLSRVWLFGTPWIAAHQASLSFTSSWSVLKVMSIELVIPYNHLVLCCSPSSPALNLSQHQGLF